jgi:hypothetical protein
MQLARRSVGLTKKRHTFCIARFGLLAAIMLVPIAKEYVPMASGVGRRMSEMRPCRGAARQPGCSWIQNDQLDRCGTAGLIRRKKVDGRMAE